MKVNITKFLHEKAFCLILCVKVVLVTVSCKQSDSPPRESKPNPDVRYPVNQADPSIFYFDGQYYLYGTNDNNPDNGFLVYVSNDMSTWVLKKQAMYKGDSFGDWGFWAPHVFKHGERFYMAYTANERIAIAESDSPLGPFKQTVKKALESPVKLIDPYVFFDDDGKKYLFHVRLGNGNRVFVSEMSEDLSETKEETTVECIRASLPWERVQGAVAEGPTVVKNNGLYYLVYSANHYQSKDYAVGYAVSNNVYGPWTKFEGNPIISRNSTLKPGSGHGDLFKDKNNELWYVFHTHNSLNSISPRLTAIVKASFVEDNSGTDKFQIDNSSFSYQNFSY
ncbi:glycoside hydrolase family 43 protein [Paradesertivirga mongoliensis]|uniref:Glycoside hydrolase family 43 protein n=1 Tax=Paradesertivirga mongoliensis TaxID=2100740 RepID=A0ABW4ZSM3_9SPHI|nr:glycoside hydrolase family 43 protein [Pedobacter mongoliensis]